MSTHYLSCLQVNIFYPFQVTVNVDGQDLAVEINTGASLSLILEETQKSL